MKVLVTGSSGRIGQSVCEVLGYENVVTFDSRDGDDVHDASALQRAIEGCDAVVHLASIIDDGLKTPEETLGENITGLWFVLSAAMRADVHRFVFMSSIQALGLAKSYRKPDYLPIDDDHPSYTVSPYGLSKALGEEACEIISRVSGMTTVCLRPPNVLAPAEYVSWQRRRTEQTETEDAGWNYGSWIDARDVASAVEAALVADISGHHRLLISADDISSLRRGDEILPELYPDVPQRGMPQDPYGSWIDSSRAKRTLGWNPTFRWQEWRAQNEADDRTEREGAGSWEPR